MVVHHTDCGLYNVNDKEIAEALRGSAKRVEGGDRMWDINELVFGAFGS